jgi:antitoxin PrlF
MQVTSKLTAKGQTTIPREVREQLSLEPGDLIGYQIEAGAVRLRKLEPVDIGYLRAVQASLSEWESPEDAEAYDEL